MKFGMLTLTWLFAVLAATAGSAQITESPETVKPGRFLVEMDALSLSVDHGGASGERYDAVGVATTFITTGITDRWDIQLGADFFLSEKYENGSFSERNSGVGDIYLRTKWNFWQDESGGTSLSLLPYVKLPTNTGGVGNNSMEGGLIVPWSQTLVGGTTLYVMGEWDLLRNDADDGYDSSWYVSATLGHELTKLVGVYAEGALAKSSGGAPWASVIGVGATLTLSENVSWDYEIIRGVSRGVADWTHVLRLNWAF